MKHYDFEKKFKTPKNYFNTKFLGGGNRMFLRFNSRLFRQFSYSIYWTFTNFDYSLAYYYTQRRFIATDNENINNNTYNSSKPWETKSASWLEHDALDKLIDGTPKLYLLPYINEKSKPLAKKLREHIYGLRSYSFSNILQFQFNADQFEQNKHLMEEQINRFLHTLLEAAIYKVILVGIDDEGDIKSSPLGCFFISKKTRVGYISMMLKNAMMSASFKYAELDFVNWILSYKLWLRTDVIDSRVDEAMKMLDKHHMRALLKDSKENIGKLVDKKRNKERYDRWINIVGSIGQCGLIENKLYRVVQSVLADGVFRVVVDRPNDEKLSWVDEALDKYLVSWVRKFDDGVYVYYYKNVYKHYEIRYKTELWKPVDKAFEYINKFGSADIETYSSTKLGEVGRQIPYAVGFMDYRKQMKMFYIREGDVEGMVVVRMIEELLQQRHNGCTFYIHNLARFDSRPLLTALGIMKGVQVRLAGREMNEIFKIRVSKKIGKKHVNVTFLDSFYQLPFKLEVLGRKFNTETKKNIFPYKFVNKDNLFYKGDAPDIKFFNGKLDNNGYAKLCQRGNWDIKTETLNYLRDDLMCLHQVIHSYNQTIYSDFLVNAVELSSYSALSKMVYLTNYYEDSIGKIPVISGFLEDWIRKAYKGGVVDVIQHIVGKAIKYDSNSHYPAAMLNTMPVGEPRVTDCRNLNDIFGFCYVEVTAPSEDKLLTTILPTWDKNGDLALS